jgi:hypothetical protein
MSVALRGFVNGAKVDLLRMGHGRIYCVTLKVAQAIRRARSFEEVAVPFSVHALTPTHREAKTQSKGARQSPLLGAPAFASLPLCVLALLVCLTFSGCTSTPAEETVTLDASRLSALSAPVVAATPQLPARDEDIEAAGDHIAEAITSLSKRRTATAPRPNAGALRALEQAEVALTRALRDKPHDEPVREALRSALRELNTAERTIQRNAYADAVRDLNSLDKKLDTLHGAEDSKM